MATYRGRRNTLSVTTSQKTGRLTFKIPQAGVAKPPLVSLDPAAQRQLRDQLNVLLGENAQAQAAQGGEQADQVSELKDQISDALEKFSEKFGEALDAIDEMVSDLRA